MIFDHILVTTDLSSDARSAYDMATFQAKAINGHITLLSVFPEFELPVVLQAHYSASETVKELRESYEHDCRARLHEIAKTDFHRMDVQEVAIFSSAPAGHEISDWAGKNGVNLIIISSHGHGALGNFFLGSTAQRVIHNAKCPVMVIPKIRR